MSTWVTATPVQRLDAPAVAAPEAPACTFFDVGVHGPARATFLRRPVT